jgi:hypothetical protein
MKMISKTPHEYAAVNLAEGDEFECEPDHVELLTRLGRAEVIPASENQKRKYQKRVAA